MANDDDGSAAAGDRFGYASGIVATLHTWALVSGMKRNRTHSQQVDFATFEAAAAASNVKPRSSRSKTMRCLPIGVSGELACCIPGLLEVVSFDTHSLSAGPDLPHGVRNVSVLVR